MTDLTTLQQSFHTLRSEPSHFAGTGGFNPRVDKFQGDKHVAMQELQRQLGVPGTEATDVFKYMGDPDLRVETLDQVKKLMGGTTYALADAGQTEESKKRFLVYYWRGIHDYLYFQLDNQCKQVEQSGWIQAG
ncbi:hypothetical protein RI367_004149 [Sorochytrium milnesiophthora]